MPVAIITEFADVVNIQGPVPVPEEPAETDQSVTYSTATQSAVFNANTRFIRIICDADAHVLFGDNPTATEDNQRLEANVEYFRGIRTGDRVSIYDGSS